MMLDHVSIEHAQLLCAGVLLSYAGNVWQVCT